MEAYIEAIKNVIDQWKQAHPYSLVPVELFDAIAKDNSLLRDGCRIYHEATEAARHVAPNVIVVFFWTEHIADSKMEYELYTKLEIDGTITCHDYQYLETDTILITTTEALESYDDDEPDHITVDDLKLLRKIVHDDKEYFEGEDLYFIFQQKQDARKRRNEEQRNVSLILPDEFLLLCEQYGLTPAQALMGFISDVCGITNFVCHPDIPPRTDGYNSNGSDERDMADSYWKRAHWSPEVEEKHGISVW